MRRVLRLLLSWQVAWPILAYVLAALLTVSVVEAFVARNEATDTAHRLVVADAHRIDLMQNEIDRLQAQVADDARERGRLEEEIRVLAAQIRQSGGSPVVLFRVPSREPSPGPTRTPRPRPTRSPSPQPSPTHSPTPTPSPSCVLPPPLRCPI